jgi:ketosteroid isomerase-like protein
MCWDISELYRNRAGKSGEPFQLQVRLTMGLRKVNGSWTVLHEHHSIPATV